MTVAERDLWHRLRRGHLGLRFRRQQAMDGYIVDFLCHPARLIIEVDGEVHEGRRQADAARDAHFARRGYRVLRVSNEDVFRRIQAVLAKIDEAVRSQLARLHGAPAREPPPPGSAPPR